MLEALIATVPVLIFFTFGGVGLITIPLLLLTVVLFARFEWNYIWITIPGALALITTIATFDAFS